MGVGWRAQSIERPTVPCGVLLKRNLQSGLRGLGQGRRRDGHRDDRRDAFEGAPDCGQSAQKGALARCIGRTRGGLNSKLHAVCNRAGKSLILLLTAG